MVFLLCIIFFLLIIRMLLNLEKDKNKKIFVLVAGTIGFFFSAFKSVGFTSDTISYANYYESIGLVTFRELFQELFNGSGKDTFYFITSKFFSMLGFSTFAWFGLISLFFMISISFFIYKYSKEPFLSFVVLIALDYFYFSMTGYRQAIAMSILLFAYYFFDKGKNLKFFVLVLFASLYHLSALLFLLIYIISKVKVNYWSLILIPVIYGLGYYGAPIIMEFWNRVVPFQYRIYGEGGALLNLSGFIIQSCILTFVVLLKKNLLINEPKYQKMIVILFWALLMQIFATFAFAEFFRVSYYFSIFTIILIPSVIYYLGKEKVYMYIGVFVILVTYIFISTGRFVEFYNFFWQ